MGNGDHCMNNAWVQAKIDEIGFGAFQLLTLLLAGGLMLAEGAEVLVMGSITTLLKGHWELSALLRGTMVAVVFIGFAAGNLLSGYIGDRFGRRVSILLGYCLIGSMGFLTGLALNPAMMVCLRFGVGVGCGVGFPSVYSLMPEVCPTHLRGSMSSLMIGFMPLGELYAALLVLFVDPTLSSSQHHCELYAHYPNMYRPFVCTWRTMCELSALPAFFFFVCSFFFLWESPQYLCAHGRAEEARVVLRKMAKMNGKSVDLDDTQLVTSAAVPEPVPHEFSYTSALTKLLSPPFFGTTLFMFLAHFTKDFSVFGLSYVLPQYFHQLETLTVGVHLTIMALLAIPGVLMAFFLTRASAIGHITSMRACAAFCALFTLGMLESSRDLIGAPCAFLCKSFAMAYFICTVVYTAEVFPTQFRNTAVGFCTSFGRAGSILAPLIFELSREHADGSFDVFLVLLAVLATCIAATAGFALTVETKGRSLACEAATVSDGQAPKYGSAQ
eukprot:TRINITY_DN24360_c1_g4_i1.p1 TRINITY_DN24360_c1_g4~~TRINITY_DN24360_c1_g4_i1.p1  ORF type:complete len:499 (+),score=54.01 TRINITY_DN24360_c1_g4_i1:83-1579(+)